MNIGYSELDEGDEGNPWWERNEDGIAGASLDSYQPVLIAIQHNWRHAQGPSPQQQQYCLQAATKITKNIIDYVKKECNNDNLCSGVCIKGRKRKLRCRGTITKPLETIYENE